MPVRGSGLAHAVPSTTLSPIRTMQEPCACLAKWPVSNRRILPPASSTLASCFIRKIPLSQEDGFASGEMVVNRAKAAAYTSTAARERSISDWAAQLLADAEFLNNVFVSL